METRRRLTCRELHPIGWGPGLIKRKKAGSVQGFTALWVHGRYNVTSCLALCHYAFPHRDELYPQTLRLNTPFLPSVSLARCLLIAAKQAPDTHSVLCLAPVLHMPSLPTILPLVLGLYSSLWSRPALSLLQTHSSLKTVILGFLPGNSPWSLPAPTPELQPSSMLRSTQHMPTTY